MKPSKLLMIIAALTLIISYFTPIWNITLDAPQYPEGLGMHIFIDDIRGEKEFDLVNINKLNHYIGMKNIVPDSIPELTYMPYLIGFLILLGLVAGITGINKIMIAWLIIFAILGILGLYDFYLWEYDYGHNLDPTAALKFEGMSYQPPLFGTKQIMNFVAGSYPATGGIAWGASFAIGFVALILNRKKK